MRIQITAEDIARGQRYAGWNCPIGHAFKRMYSSRNAFVGIAACLDNNVSIMLPSEALAWRARFDRGELVEPIELSFSPELIYQRNI